MNQANQQATHPRERIASNSRTRLGVITAFVSLIVLVTALGGCGRRRSGGGPISTTISRGEGRIIGGHDVTGVNPLTRSVAALLMYKADQMDGAFTVCTATFLTNQVLLTAAHCLPEDLLSAPRAMKLKKTQYALRLKRSVDVWDSSPEFEVAAWKAHPKFNSKKLTNDLALVYLKDPQADVLPLQLVPSEHVDGLFKVGKFQVHSIGFGRTSGLNGVSETDTQGLGRLRAVDLELKKFSKRAHTFQVDMSQGRAFCGGDSGGPALIADYGYAVLGVVSSYESKSPTVDCDLTGDYTNVLPYRAWIETEIDF